MAQLGRIGGPLLEQNLRRDNVDLKFSNTTYDSTSTLYLNVKDGRIGVNRDVPGFDLDINNDIKTTNAIVDNTAKIDNVIIQAPSSFTTRVGPINITPTSIGPKPVIEFERMRSDDLEFNDNTISGLTSNQSIDIRAREIDVTSSTNVYGDMGVTGSVTVDGNLTHAENIILGDELYNPNVGGGQGDVVEIIPDFSQSIIPGDDNTWNLGTGTLIDSSVRRWSNAYITDNLVNTDVVLPLEVRISDQTQLNGITNEIFALQSNEDIVLAPHTGINYIESTRWQEITASSSSASISGTTLTISGTITGSFIPGTLLTGVGIIPGTIITGTSTGSDSSGTYTVNINYNGAGSNPSPTGTIAITGTVDVIENLTDIGGGPRFDPQTPLTFTSTGIGYIRFMGDNGFVIPAGSDAERPTRPELGDTRWNTDLERLEAFAGLIEVVTAIGNVSGLANQLKSNLVGTTNGNGENARFNITISSGSFSIAIAGQGQGYSTNDLITIPGTVFTGGSSPANDIVVTVGAQTDDGYNIATGGGAEVDVNLMEELGNEYSLILG
jgi:hypothetical protein